MVAPVQPQGETIEETFQGYMTAVDLDDAPPDQVREMRRAFYAGAWMMLCVNHEIGGDDVPQEVGLRRLERLIEECQQHKENVLAGVA